jgi:mannitol/fructose-specific phosphotransferase system IIA component (Ntr-type)
VLNLADILKPPHVDLSLGTDDPAQGIEHLARLLQGDPGIVHWEAFHAALQRGGSPVGTHALLSHVRTDQVSTMLMAAGRTPELKSIPTTSIDGSAQAVNFLFVIAVPMTLAADYLRIVGALARSLRNPAIIAALRATRSAAEFVHILCAEAEEM